MSQGIKLSEAKKIIEELENIDQGNILINIHRIFEGRNKKDVKRLIYALNIDIKKEIEFNIKGANVFKNYNIIIVDYKLKLRHKLRDEIKDLKINYSKEHEIDLT